MKKSMLPISSIRTDRKISEDDNLDELVESIQKRGILHPLSIDEESSLLIDGLRRMTAYSQLGHDEVPVFRVNDVEGAVELHAKAQKNPVAARHLTPQRVWEFYSAIERVRNKRTTELRSRSVAKRYRATPVRDLILTALPGYNEASLAASLAVYKKFSEETDPSMLRYYVELRAALDSGEVTIFQARHRVIEALTRHLNGDVVKDSEQRNLLAAAIDQFSGTNSALARLGSLSPDLNETELRAYIKALGSERRKLTSFVNTLKKRADTK